MKTATSLEKLLASFGPNALSTGTNLLHNQTQQKQRPVFLTQIAEFDQLNGGLKRGTLVEVTGQGSSGKFSLELAMLAAFTSAGENAALVDWGDHFDPQTAEGAGVELERVFWLRPEVFADALKSTEIVLDAGFRLVILDLGVNPLSDTRTSEAVWMRFAREAKLHDSIVFVLSPTSIGSASADMSIEVSNLGSSWTNVHSRWRLLENLSIGLRVVRERGTSRRQKNQLSLSVRDKI